MVERLDFLFCPEDAPCPPRVDHSRYERVVWCGVSFRRFTRLWTPERSHFFSPSFQERALAVFLCAQRQRAEGRGQACLGHLPVEILVDIVSHSAARHELAKEDYDDLPTVRSGARHLFLPAPGSSGLRDTLFDAVFGLA